MQRHKRARQQNDDATSAEYLGPWAGWAGEDGKRVGGPGTTALERGDLTLKQKLIRVDQGLDPDKPGKMEPEALTAAKMRLMAEQIGIQRIDLHDGGGYLAFTAKPAIDPMTVIQLIQRNPRTYAMQGSDRLKITNKTESGEQRALFLRALLTQLGARS